jgi:hypothetical protein
MGYMRRALSNPSLSLEDEQISDAVAEVQTVQSTSRTQYGFPIEPKRTVTTTVMGRDSTGFTSLILAAKRTEG